MWTLRRSDLKYRLTLRIMTVSALCFAVTSAYFLIDIDRSARARLDTVADITAKDLELQKSTTDWIRRPRADFPDLQVLAAALLTPGQCMAYRPSGGPVLQRICLGVRPDESGAPAPFAALYRELFDPGRESVRPVYFHGRKEGEALAWADPVSVTAQAWHGAGRPILAMIITLLLLCGLVYAALARALRPTRLIRAGLERIAANDLSTRLPPFDLAELSAIRDVFNHLAESLAAALAERNELTRRLIALQDDERRHLARELHDEFGQYLAAIRALASSAAQSAAQTSPGILAECHAIARAAAHLSESLRGTLFGLRPPDIEELGLAASLEGLMAGWNGRCRGRTRFEIRVDGDFEGLPPALRADLYRIAQEAITNAAKHADAAHVELDLKMHPTATPSCDGAARQVELIVKDDGQAAGRERAAKAGMGLLGMRERVASLGGTLAFEVDRTRGSALRVEIPVAADIPSGARECPA